MADLHELSLESTHYDLVTPDGVITDLKVVSDYESLATVFIEKISPLFVGYQIGFITYSVQHQEYTGTSGSGWDKFYTY